VAETQLTLPVCIQEVDSRCQLHGIHRCVSSAIYKESCRTEKWENV